MALRTHPRRRGVAGCPVCRAMHPPRPSCARARRRMTASGAAWPALMRRGREARVYSRNRYSVPDTEGGSRARKEVCERGGRPRFREEPTLLACAARSAAVRVASWMCEHDFPALALLQRQAPSRTWCKPSKAPRKASMSRRTGTAEWRHKPPCSSHFGSCWNARWWPRSAVSSATIRAGVMDVPCSCLELTYTGARLPALLTSMWADDAGSLLH